MRRLPLIGLTLALLAAACTGTDSTAADSTTTTVPEPTDATSTTIDVVPTTGVGSAAELPGDLPLVTGSWETDWSRTTIDLAELKVGIAASDPRDLIPPIDAPMFESAPAAGDWLGEQEPGVLVTVGELARFYPLSILTRHEIVNDVIGDLPLAITYCPLCNTAVAFDRRFGGETLRFGVSGLLRNSDLVMWDDATESLWQQITGEAIVGAAAGSTLTFVPSRLVSFEQFRQGYPDGEVLSQHTGFGIRYGLNPYEFYSSRDRPYNFFDGELDDRYPALERVVGVSTPDGSKAYPFSVIAEARAINDDVGSTPIAVFWGGATTDALDAASIADSRAVGTGVAYSAIVDDLRLTFTPGEDDTFVDAETGTRWSLLGKALEGPLRGRQLDPIVHRNEFWFAWTAFFPEADVYSP